MRISILAIAISSIITGCTTTDMNAVGGAIAGGVASALVGGGGTFSPGSGGPAYGGDASRLPDTPQCREYLRYARHAGAPGTQSPLIQKYNACLNSKPNSAAARRYRCAPGTYVSIVDGVKGCRKR